MTRTKKFLSFIITIAMILSLSMMALAADPVPTTGSITITHAEDGVTYTAYKIFDATLTEIANGDYSVSYTIAANSPWYSVVSATNSPFALTAIDDPVTKYSVQVEDSITDAEIIAFLKAAGIPTGATAADTETAASGEAKFEDLALGYYYITGNDSKLAAITPMKPNATIVDKSQDPTLTKGVATAANGTYSEASTAAMGDTAYFKIDAYCPRYSNQQEIVEYKFTDTLDAGFTYNTDSAKLYDNNTEITDGVTVSYDSTTNVLTINYVLPDNYEGKTLTIKYTATVDADAVYENNNTVSLDLSYVPYDDPSDPSNTPNVTPTPSWTDNPSITPAVPTPPDDDTTTNVYGIELTKYKDSIADGNELDGAQFELYESDGTTKINLIKVADGQYRVALANETAITTFTTKDGVVTIYGLDVGDYKIKETQAPENYNILTEFTDVTIDGTEAVVNGYAYEEVSIVNNHGTVLPSTGGVGTTVFFICGGVLMLGALIVLITKKRMSSKNTEE